MSLSTATYYADRPFADFELRLRAMPNDFVTEATVARERTVQGIVFPRDAIEGWANADDPARAAADMSAPLFAEAVEDAFIQARKLADDGVRVRINLDGAAALVNRLPWEYVRAPGEELPLAFNPDRPFARLVGQATMAAPTPRRDGPLHLLVYVDV
ncbi:MAG: hypothetical protein KDD83_29170, partial [Caldilineaceae bacterium]|nr:hypothetical protein [Caldilineaceae bacterium]